MAFTPEEVTKAVVIAQNRVGRESHESFARDYPDEAERWPYEDITVPEWDEIRSLDTSLGAVVLVEQVGGGEGDGEHVHVVLKTVATGQLFRINGHYYSYDGTNWDYSNLYEVRAVTKTVVVYE